MLKKLICIGLSVMIAITLSACSNKSEIKESNKENDSIVVSNSTETNKDNSQNVDDRIDNKKIIKLTKEDILKGYKENTYSSNYSNLGQEFKNLFYIYYGIELKPDFVYQIDINEDGNIEEIKIKDGNLYINNHLCKPNNDNFGWSRFFVTDLDRNDNKLEIILQGVADIESNYFFNYDGNVVKYLGEVWGIEVDGFGNIISYTNHVSGINNILMGYYKLTESGLRKQDINYDKNVEHTAGKLIFSENIDEIKQYINWIGNEGEKFKTHRENAEVLEEGTRFNLLDVFDDGIPFIKLQDGREGYIMDYYAVEDVTRYM